MAGPRRATPPPLPDYKPTQGAGLFRVNADNVVYADRGETVRLPLNGATNALVESGLLVPVKETPVPESAPVETEGEADNG
jgi:hypothetical protein